MKYESHVKFTTFAAVALAIALAFAPTSASATTGTANFAVSATVTNTCTISAAALSFGAYTGAAAVTGSSSITVNCTNLALYSVALSTGAGTYTTRTMANGTATLGYNLYTTTGDTTVWGDGTGSTASVAGTGTGSNQTLTVYGKIPTGETSLSGTYSDTITATITY
jgi:spore coat protein U-like protein